MDKRKYTYRFKTKDEFINEFGVGWRRLEGWTSFPEAMDCLLGTDIGEKNYQYIDNGEQFTIVLRDGRYGIIPIMVTKVEEKIPNYNPKKFIY